MFSKMKITTSTGNISQQFEQIRNKLKNAAYICINLGESYCPEEIAERAFA